ncbi:pantoate--beta-alanine ligase [Chelatococcus sambhunathii]|uniref:Pantothenate synthetase n=1 Tax=Chelatococcus sambhunathii TaxID=363953 RepID=A0ABU1DEC4_9HYPH|nr:pantoate--beta-alanine ligase [Chelatococcus sambhunathii]MDR4306444.1 pantoate--beta-alanine ligase [Chelatococcus sambhunathii]
MPAPAVVTTVEALRAVVDGWRRDGERVALVPTMGALHAGHLALVAEARRAATRTVVSIFVNPTQFAPHEDLATYPRNLESDLAALAPTGADLVFAPDVGEMYPEGASTVVTVGGPSEGLESVARPHFFAGVATVVAKLLIQCAADVAVFGEKDFQQLAVVRRMARDLSIPTTILGVPTIREPSGLAMSSRNAYLSDEERARAAGLHAALARAAEAIGSGQAPADALTRATAQIEASGFTLDYVELRDAETLQAFEPRSGRPGRLLAAARIAGVRLIDNVPVTISPDHA